MRAGEGDRLLLLHPDKNVEGASAFPLLFFRAKVTVSLIKLDPRNSGAT